MIYTFPLLVSHRFSPHTLLMFEIVISTRLAARRDAIAKLLRATRICKNDDITCVEDAKVGFQTCQGCCQGRESPLGDISLGNDN